MVQVVAFLARLLSNRSRYVLYLFELHDTGYQISEAYLNIFEC
jgi:hypothetical protein